ncbi:hypothetical protein [Bowmanella dokdonensis]|uniref:Uncharacterized protein n=1 Tax=Bowmanella dokdonensis TaxID=751969 RepID=A0A939IM09_9ALTE|nr:hypothetical protein [Bowmanella dokdonensis]MBN7824788.1 hypothetical protein [Bowmanella dokdonensis]
MSEWALSRGGIAIPDIFDSNVTVFFTRFAADLMTVNQYSTVVNVTGKGVVTHIASNCASTGLHGWRLTIDGVVLEYACRYPNYQGFPGAFASDAVITGQNESGAGYVGTFAHNGFILFKESFKAEYKAQTALYTGAGRNADVSYWM